MAIDDSSEASLLGMKVSCLAMGIAYIGAENRHGTQADAEAPFFLFLCIAAANQRLGAIYKLKHWRASPAIFAWKGSPNGILHSCVLSSARQLQAGKVTIRSPPSSLS